MKNNQAIEADLAAQRALLARLYKIWFLADPDARTQIPGELIEESRSLQQPGTTIGALGTEHATLVRQELRDFFAAVEHQVVQARLTSLQSAAP